MLTDLIRSVGIHFHSSNHETDNHEKTWMDFVLPRWWLILQLYKRKSLRLNDTVLAETAL